MITLNESNYGSLLRDMRIENNLSQKELSSLTGISESCISRIENQKISPTISTYLRLIHELGYVISIEGNNSSYNF
jgi:transcriptional regulator with XRE-family HTH domain